MTPIPRASASSPSLGTAFSMMGKNAISSLANFNPLSALGGIAGSIFSSIGGAIGAKKQRNFQREMMEKQFAFAREMFDKNNQWNSPANRRKLMEEAGYNPFYSDTAGIVGQTGPTAPGSAGSAPPALGAQMFGQGMSSIGNLMNSSASVRATEMANNTNYIKTVAEIAKIKNDVVRDNSLLWLQRQRADQEFQESVARINEMSQNVLTSKSVQLFNNVKAQQTAVEIVQGWLDSLAYRSYLGHVNSNLDSQTLLNNFDGWLKYPAVTVSRYAQQLISAPENRKSLFKLAEFMLFEPKFRYELDRAMNISTQIKNNREGFGSLATGLGATVGAGALFSGSRSGSSPSASKHNVKNDKMTKYHLEYVPRTSGQRGVQKKYKRVYEE
jgi:hypothetical protein